MTWRCERAQVRAINKVIRDEDCYKGLDAMVKAFTTSLPLVAELRSPAMRDRHWAALMAATKKDINVNDPSFSLQHLLDLELHKFEEEVGEIVDQASKEEKMEVALARLNETWEKMEFQFVQHKATDVYTIKMAEEDFEAMEDNQVQVQVRATVSLRYISSTAATCPQRVSLLNTDMTVSLQLCVHALT